MPRTPDLHHYHCSLLEGHLFSYNSTTYGVNYNSCLKEIPLFNVADWQLPQDVIHVLLGVPPLQLKLLLHNLQLYRIISLWRILFQGSNRFNLGIVSACHQE